MECSLSVRIQEFRYDGIEDFGGSGDGRLVTWGMEWEWG